MPGSPSLLTILYISAPSCCDFTYDFIPDLTEPRVHTGTFPSVPTPRLFCPSCLVFYFSLTTLRNLAVVIFSMFNHLVSPSNICQ